MVDKIKETEHRIALLFDESPISLWDEDFTEVKVYLDILKKEGISEFRIFFDENPEELAICSRKVKILDVNKAALKLHGAKNKDDLFGNIYKIFTKESLEVFKEELIILAEGGTKFESEAVVKTLHGEEINIFIKFNVMYSEETDKNVVRALVAATDITKRMESEEELLKLSTAVKQSPNMVVLTDLSGNIIYTNPKFTKITGYDLKEVIGTNPSILKSGEMKDEFYTNLWETISSGEIWKGEMSNKKKDGTIYWEKAIISPVVDKDKKTINFLKIAEDITDKKRMESELQHHREHLEELVADRTKELEEKNNDLERLNKLFVNRESRIKELRKELKKYEK